MKLSTKARKALPAAKFAGPNRSYPVEDKSHAADAKARASEAVNAGRMSRSSEEKIDAKANRVLRAGARDGLGGGKGGMAVHASAKGAGMHSDRPMRHEKY